MLRKLCIGLQKGMGKSTDWQGFDSESAAYFVNVGQSLISVRLTFLIQNLGKVIRTPSGYYWN